MNPSPKAHGPIIAEWRNIFAVIDDGLSTPAQYELPEKKLARHALAYPGQVGCLIVIPHGTPQPPEATRNAVNVILDRHAGAFLGLAWVVEGKGFNSALTRATLTTMALARRRPHAWRVTTSVEEAIGWLVTRKSVGRDVDFRLGLEAIAEARTRAPSASSAAEILSLTRSRQPEMGRDAIR